MFKLNQSATFYWPVEVQVPVDGGKFEKQTFDAQFKRVSQTRLQEMREAIERNEVTDAGFVADVMVGWRGVTDEGQELPFSPTTLEQLLNVPSMAASIVLAFIKAHSGVARKN
jgi:hypothetical protein